MLKQLLTLVRGRSNDASQSILDANAVALLRQQMREAGDGVNKSRKAVAVVMAYSQREKVKLSEIETKITKLESRVEAALDQGREDLALEGAQAIATLESERDATQRTIEIYTTDIARLKAQLSKSEALLSELKRGQRIAEATEKTQKIRGDFPEVAKNDLSDASETLKRLQERHAQADATLSAMESLSADDRADDVEARLAEAGMGPAMSVSAEDILTRLKSKKSSL